MQEKRPRQEASSNWLTPFVGRLVDSNNGQGHLIIPQHRLRGTGIRLAHVPCFLLGIRIGAISRESPVAQRKQGEICMSDALSLTEIDRQHVELLPARTVLSVFAADGGTSCYGASTAGGMAGAAGNAQGGSGTPVGGGTGNPGQPVVIYAC
jgi:hypothetical protein